MPQKSLACLPPGAVSAREACGSARLCVSGFATYTRVQVTVSSIGAQGWSRFVAALAALVLVVTAVAAGARYVVCARSGTTHTRACCAQPRAKAFERPPSPAEYVPARSCCEPRVVPMLGGSATQHVPPALEAGSPAITQVAWDARLRGAAACEPRGGHWPIRAGPREQAERRALLQVFLI